MKTDLDTLLIALYVLVDDHVIPAEGRRTGRPKKLSDAELVCLAVAQVLLGARSEHHWMRTCYARLGHLFPYLPNQPGYHKRVKAAAPLICRATEYLATLCPSWTDDTASVRRHPGAVWNFAGDRPPFGAGRAGRLRLLRLALALVLGAEAVPAHHRRRHAGGLVPGQPEDRRTGGRP